MHNLYPPKIVHKQDLYMKTCTEGGDSAQPHANLSNLQSYTPTVITVYGLPLNRHSLTHTQPSSLHTASLRPGTRSLTPTFITVYGMSYESDNSVAMLSLVSRNPFWTTHNTKIRSAERKAGQTKVCQFYRLVFLLGYRQCDHLSLAIEPSSWYIGRMSEWRDLNS